MQKYGFYAGKIVYNFQFACIIFTICGMPLHNKKYLAILADLKINLFVGYLIHLLLLNTGSNEFKKLIIFRFNME